MNRLITFLILCLFSIQSFGSSSDFGHLELHSNSLQNGHRIEMETISIDQNLKDEKILEWSAKELSAGKKSTIQVILTENESRNQEVELFLLKLKIRLGLINQAASKTISEYRTHVNNEVRKIAGDGKRFLEKHERISLSLLRVVVNGSTVSAGLILNGGISPQAGIAIGLFSGALSGLFQYFNAQYQTIINGNHERNQELVKTKKYGKTIVKTTQMSKWFFTEVSLYTVLNIFNSAMGVPMSGSFSTEAIKVLKSSVMATASQGLWDSTIASETKERLRNAEGNELEQARIQMKSNIKTFAVSMASMFGGVMSLMGSNIGHWSLGALGVTGVIYTYFTYRNGQKEVRQATGISGNCKKTFIY